MIEHLTLESFKEKIFYFDSESEWKYKGDKPCLIDFYASWCNPCKMVAPILEEINNENDNLVIYKVNTEDEQELSSMFGIRSIPSMLFVPMNESPQMSTGALPKQTLEKAINDVLKV